jgi:magnesium-transporting ATPase (P-type)
MNTFFRFHERDNDELKKNNRIRRKKMTQLYTVVPLTESTLWHQKNIEKVAEELHVDVSKGLSKEEAKINLIVHGANELFGNGGISIFKLFLSNCFNAMNFILIAALIFSGVVLYDWVKVSVLCVVLVLNSAVGFYQEYQSEQTMEALRKMSSPTAHVRRDGDLDLIPCPDVVPGLFNCFFIRPN